MKTPHEPRPRITARFIGILLLLMIAGGVFAQGYVSNRLVIPSDAPLTAKNLLANRGLFQLSFTVYLVEMASQIAATALFYALLSPVNRPIALVAAFIDVAASIIKTFSRVFYITPLFLLSGNNALSAFNADQLRALTMLLLRINDRGAGIAVAFFGISGLLNGYLIFRSAFLPRALGILWMCSSIGWLRYFYPPLRFPSFTFIAVFSLLVCAAQIFWLIVYGVDEEKWKDVNRLSTQGLSTR
jgi:general stress protein CsbA